MEDQIHFQRRGGAPNLGLKAMRAPHQYSKNPEFACTNCGCTRYSPCSCEHPRNPASKTNLRAVAFKIGANGKGGK